MATTQIYSGAENSSQEHSNFLRRTVQWDAEIIVICSVLLVIFASPIAAFMRIENPNILRIAGIIGVLYDGGRLLWSMMSNPIDMRLAKLSLYGNALWAIISIPVLALEVLPAIQWRVVDHGRSC